MEDLALSQLEINEVWSGSDGAVRFVNCKIICYNIPTLPATAAAPKSEDEDANDERDDVDAVGIAALGDDQNQNRSQETRLDSVSPSAYELFSNCMFKPASQDGKTDDSCLQLFQQKIYSQFAGGRTYSFINCQFVEREPTMLEQLAMKLKEITGLQVRPTTARTQGLMEVHNSKVKLKQIPAIGETVRKISFKRRSRRSSKRKSKS